MIVEAALAISLASGADLGTTRVGLSKDFKESNPLMGPSLSQQIVYTAGYTLIGTLVTHKIEKRYGERAGKVTLILFCVTPIVAASLNATRISFKHGK